MNDDSIGVGYVVYGLLALLVGSTVWAAYSYSRGGRLGACVEMCRPAKFDADQEVNGGCLCIGSDKVLRFRPAP